MKAIGALQGKTVSVPLSVSMTAASDTGISNSDGITKNRTPVVSGVAMPSATVTLYANNQIVGSTIAASNGQWSVTSQELADGTYDLSASIQTVQGAVIQQKIKTITIDTAAPQIASVTGLMDGVAWESSDVFSGSLRDADNQTQLQYWINNGPKQTIGLTNNASNLDFNNIALSQISNLSTNSEHKLYLKAIDRAGNETQYDYSFMRLELPEMTEDTDWTGPVGGGSDDRTWGGSGSTGGALPSGAGGYFYIGVGGAWGYSSGSGGGGDWNPANFGGGSSALPTKPGQDPNEQLTYLQALNVILNTAVDALSKHSSVVSKKQVLGEFKSDLLAMGKVIEFYGLHEGFKTQFNELFSLGYDKTDNRVSWQEAVIAGWKFAKSVALDSKPVRLKAFESQLFGMVRGMMVRENISLSAIQEQSLKQTLEIFSRRYAALNPARSQYSWNSYDSGFEEMIWGIGIRGRVSGRWSWNNELFSNGPAIENGWLGWDSFKHLKGLLTGLNAQQIIDGFENTHILISGATRTGTLRRSGAAHVRFGEFLNKLMETGFTLTRVGATNPAGLATSSSAWLEGVLEKNVQLVAGGLGQFFQGLDATSSYSGYSRYTNIFADTLDYGQRLMKVAAAVDNTNIRQDVLKSDVLSELVNLGGAYISLKPDVTTAEPNGQKDPGDFLDTVYRENNLVEAKTELQDFLSNFKLTSSKLTVLNFQQKVFHVLRGITPYSNKLKDIRFSSAISVLSGHYSAIFEPAGKNLQTSGLLGDIWRTRNILEVNALVVSTKQAIGNPSVITEQDLMGTLLDQSTPWPNSNSNSNTHIDYSSAWQGPSNQWPSLPQNFQFSSNTVANKKAIIVAPYEQQKSSLWSFLSETKREADRIESTLKTINFQVNRLNNFKVKDLLDPSNLLSSYGVIAFSSHGTGYLHGRISHDSGASVVMTTNEQVVVEDILEYRKLLLDTTLVIAYGDFAITPEFIKKYSGSSNSNSIAYLGACQSLYNDSLATAFHSIGAGAVFGYDKVVGDAWAADHGIALFNALSTGRNVRQLPFIGDIQPFGQLTVFKAKINSSSANLALRSN